MARVIKWVLLSSVLLMVVTVIIVVALVAAGPRVSSGSVLRVTLHGALPESPEPKLMGPLLDHKQPTLLSVVSAIRRAAADSRIAGLVLDVRDPELGAAQVLDIEEAMAVFRASGKWIVLRHRLST